MREMVEVRLDVRTRANAPYRRNEPNGRVRLDHVCPPSHSDRTGGCGTTGEPGILSSVSPQVTIRPWPRRSGLTRQPGAKPPQPRPRKGFADTPPASGNAGRISLRRATRPATELRDLGAVLAFVAVRHVGDQILQVVLRSVPGENAGLPPLLERNPRQHLSRALVGLGVLGDRLFRALPASLLDLGIVERFSPAHHQAERIRRFL